MKSIMLLSLILFSILFTDCKKEPDIPKQYLFDGLPYYLADTLFYTEGSSREMLYAYDMQLDSKGFVWIRDNFWNLHRYDPATEELILWNTTEIIGVDPAPGNLQTIFLDSKDRVWCGQYGSLYMFDGTYYRCYKFYEPNDVPCEMSEDKEGNIHFCGYYQRKAYIWDGVSVIQSDPDFTTDDIFIYKMTSDKEKNLWYFVDMTPGVSDEETYAVRYSNKNEYTMIQEIHDGHHLEDFKSIGDVAFDGDNTPYMIVSGNLMHINSNDELETLWEYNLDEDYNLHQLFIDREDNVWAFISKQADDDPNIAIFKDGGWITVSPHLGTIRDRNYLNDIEFPDNNTVWVCTSGGIFVFKK